MNSPTTPSFSVIPGSQVRDVLIGREQQVTQVIEAAYRLHGEGRTVNPDSYFLRFPDDPASRIIALPASVRGDVDVHGIKWISSFPANLNAGLPRASAVLILNDPDTGHPFACLESSIISAARTAASAALAAVRISQRRGGKPRRISFVGTGLIARYIHTYLSANGFEFDELGVHDRSAEYAAAFEEYLRRTETGTITVRDEPEELIRSADLVVFATTAGEPHVTEPSWFAHHPLVLHVSLRDLSPEIILSACNITDDVEHCMKANTSLHLTEQRTGNRDFVAGAMPELLAGSLDCPADRPVIFSPFGLGVLDLAVGKYVHDQLAAAEQLHVVPGFFAELNRYA
ncbi:2,3-diaminopropionate biosynthesis protein SbnB [Saccharopolyspora sp. K220]|uniref:2,3-diaminopropionate biosynthesis protein SbnB n=1 Tax=Saccharopolyspora soli TaxID=2926618 RepID=UPI001F560C08|nr:2,3-diaminopropionate biosynthesis protein SbnB [Saccharopolyspora soli]MCI2418852.1 2,3-diaminopropionate biosynthesis protein SbnB [Saccharopolyspora soli]